MDPGVAQERGVKSRRKQKEEHESPGGLLLEGNQGTRTCGSQTPVLLAPRTGGYELTREGQETPRGRDAFNSRRNPTKEREGWGSRAAGMGGVRTRGTQWGSQTGRERWGRENPAGEAH